MQIPYGKKNDLIRYGFYANRTHDIIEFENCQVGFKNSHIILNAVKDGLNKYGISIYDEKNKTGIFKEVLLRHANNTSDVSITYILNDKNYKQHIDLYKKFDNYVLNELNNISFDDKIDFVTTTLNINTLNNVILSDNNVVLRGNGYIEDCIKSIKYHISPESFYQINSKMTEKLYDLILDFGNFSKDSIVLDLYCGIGTISLYIANAVKYVIGIECIAKAVENAISNSLLNNIKNAMFICDIVSDKLYDSICDLLSKQNVDIKSVDTIIVDPPRKGLEDSALKLIKSINPSKIIYVSCDPATLARDLCILCAKDTENPYKLMKVSNVDMFPHTMHIETIALLQK